MAVWFEGSGEIGCSIEHVAKALGDHGDLFAGVVRRMPGLTSVELVEQGNDYVTIETNEGLMERTNIAKNVTPDRIVVEYDERYKAGSMVTATSHFSDEFTTSGAGVSHRLVMSDVDAPGLLGFFYKKFGNSKTGNAFLAAYKAQLEELAD